MQKEKYTIKTRTFEKDGFNVTVEHIIDTDADLSYLEQDYKEESPADRSKYQKQDRARLTAYHQGDWYMLGIAVTVRKQTASNWADGGLEVGRASVWGFESDSEESYLKAEEEYIIIEAFTEVERLKAAISALPVKGSKG